MKRLDDLILLVEVVKRGGFSEAARHLGMQRSKLSRRIGELEQRMGVRLLQRNSRHISLTTVGEMIYNQGVTVEKAASEAFLVAESYASVPAGILRIGCSPTFATHVLPEIITDFNTRFGEIKFELCVKDQFSDLINDRLDLSFRISAQLPDDSSLICRHICRLPLALVAHPQLSMTKDLFNPAQLTEIPMLALANRSGEQQVIFCGPNEAVFNFTFSPHVVSGNMQTLLALVHSGIGAAVVPRYLCNTDLNNRSLIEPLPFQTGWLPESSWAYALMPSRKNMSSSVRTFLDFALPFIKKKICIAANM